jgi:endogenous inhibitor of DNA gyrase (YacG/DUF329 family)
MISTRCPVCEAEMAGPDQSAWPDFPFCSSRCRLIDLGRWLGEKYRVTKDSEDSEPNIPTDQETKHS